VFDSRCSRSSCLSCIDGRSVPMHSGAGKCDSAMPVALQHCSRIKAVVQARHSLGHNHHHQHADHDVITSTDIHTYHVCVSLAFLRTLVFSFGFNSVILVVLRVFEIPG